MGKVIIMLLLSIMGYNYSSMKLALEQLNHIKLTNIEEKEIAHNPYFFNANTTRQVYNGLFMFMDIVEEQTILNITPVAKLKYGNLYELKLDPNEELPDEFLSLGYFYVQEDKIYRYKAEEKIVKQLQLDEDSVPLPEIVCQSEEVKDELREDEKGWHVYIEVNGDYSVYHSYSNLVETGYYETFYWKKGEGLIGYKSGWGAGKDSIALELGEFDMQAYEEEQWNPIKQVQEEDAYFIEEDNKEENDTILYINKVLGFEVDLPEIWEGKYIIEEKENGVIFRHKVEDKDGMILYEISVYESEEALKEHPIPWYTELGRKEETIYIGNIAGDYPYDMNTEEGMQKVREVDALCQAIDWVQCFHIL